MLQVAGTTKKATQKKSTAPAVLTGTVPEWANSTAIAQLLGKTTRRIQQLTQDGILKTEVPPGGGARKGGAGGSGGWDANNGYGKAGSGMHVNMSLMKDGKNAFYDPDDSLGLSKTAYSFIAGILEHARGMCAVTNPLVNSYKRMVPGFEAPIFIAWSATNRSPLIRIPASRGESTRVELRSPDPAANPYLVLAICLAAGLDGIRGKIEPPEDVHENVFSMGEAERERLGIEALPQDLEAAVEELEKDEFVKNVLGTHITEKYITAKRADWTAYRSQVTRWEIDEYLYKI